MTTRSCRAAARIFLALLLSLFLRPLSFAEETPALTPNPSPAASYDAEAMRRWSLHEMMVKLCEDHIIWLRSLIVSAAWTAGLPRRALSTPVKALKRLQAVRSWKAASSGCLQA